MVSFIDGSTKIILPSIQFSCHLLQLTTILKYYTEEYYKIVSLLGNYASNYQGLNNDNIKRLYFPTIVFVKNGEIISFHEGTIDSQTNPFVELSDKEKNDIKTILANGIVKTYDMVCDENC